jgi:hypothetical protein
MKLGLSCIGKQAFDNRGDALRVQRVRKNRKGKRTHKGDKASFDVYQCRACGKWHMGGMYLG